MRIRAALAAAVLFAAAAAVVRAQSITLTPSGDNQRSTVTQGIGLVQVSVEYSSPDVHAPDGTDRNGHIWGELVPYGLHDLGFNDCRECPWRAGANENTVFRCSHDVQVEGEKLPAGAYGVHMIAGKDEWTVIFSRNSTSWGSYTYDPKEDFLRVKVKPAAGAYHEFLNYEFIDRQPDRATVALQWESLQVPIRITVPDIHDLWVEQYRRELRGRAWFNWTNWEAAARYCLENKTHLDQGLAWAQVATGPPLAGSENLTTLGTLAQLQIANGKREDARKTVAKAMARGEDVLAYHQFGRQLQGMGENELALDVFVANAKSHPKQWPVNVGLARGYAGVGDTRKAILHARLAMAQAPDDVNRKNLQSLIDQWEKTPAK